MALSVLCKGVVAQQVLWMQEKYAEALQRAPESAKQQRAVYAANRAAVQLKQQCWKEAIRDCSEALELDPEYIKALLRRATAYEALDDLEHTLSDYQKVDTFVLHGCGQALHQPCMLRCVLVCLIGPCTWVLPHTQHARVAGMTHAPPPERTGSFRHAPRLSTSMPL